MVVMDERTEFPGAIQMQTICESISEGVIAVDTEMRILFLNRAAERLTATPRRKALGRHCYEVLHLDACETNCALRETLRTGEPLQDRPVCLLRGETERLPVQVSTALLRDEDGVVIGGVETLRDMSLVERLRRDIEGRYTVGDIVSKSPRMREVLGILPAVAESDSTVLIRGESGTGKELLARAIHHESRRKSAPFVVVNCAALPESLIESELFGYVKGAFTDARGDKPGQVALADRGTLFLDEVGELSASVQAKLLRVLQERTFLPVGATKPARVDVRFIAATNQDLAKRMEEGDFRSDLYYRLNVVPLLLPPLRERREDIPVLAHHFIERFGRIKGKSIEGISEEALALLTNHPLPGNVRQLENAIEHAFVLCPCGRIEAKHLPHDLRGDRPVPVIEIAEELSELEAMFILAALKRNRWSRKDTATELGIHPSTLYRKMRNLGIKTPPKDGRSARHEGG
jgi:PAS domain S-box-containing protein